MLKLLLIAFIAMPSLAQAVIATLGQNVVQMTTSIQRREILSINSLSDYNLQIRAIRNTNPWDLNSKSLPIRLIYFGKNGRLIDELKFDLDLKPCKRSSPNEICIDQDIALNTSANPWVCGIKLKMGEDESNLEWGTCEKTVNPSIHKSDIFIKDVIQKDNILSLSMGNKGDDLKNLFRAYIAFLDKEGRPLTYQIKEFREGLGQNATLNFDIDVQRIFDRSCKVKIILDPDGFIDEKEKSNNLLVEDFGECSGDDFNPIFDLAAENLKIETAGQDIRINFETINAGDLPVGGKPLTLQYRLLGQGAQFIAGERSQFSGYIAPLERLSVNFIVPASVWRLGCSLEVQVDPENSFNDLNRLNNSIILNICK